MTEQQSKNLMPISEVNSSRSREQHSIDSRKGGLASVESKKEKKLLAEEILKRMGAEDWEEITRNLVERAKESDSSFALLRDTIGQKPTEKQEVTAAVNMTMEDFFGQIDDGWHKS